jgi:hypothetical protein
VEVGQEVEARVRVRVGCIVTYVLL